MFMEKVDDIRPCPCCGQDRPTPTTPGSWEYRHVGHDEWHPVRVEDAEDTDYLVCIPEFDTGIPADETGDHEGEPMWWPDNVEWRRRQ